MTFISLPVVSMKWMDRPRVTKMNRGGVYEIDRQTKRHQKLNATDIVQNFITHSSTCPQNKLKNSIHFGGIYIFLTLCLSFNFINTSSVHFCETLSVYPFHLISNNLCTLAFSRKCLARTL